MLTIREVYKAFGPVQAVRGLTLEVRAGEVLGLLGPNGAGKTTTISMAVGLLAPDSGAVRVEANGASGPPSDPAVRRVMGVAPQSLALYDELTAEENLAYFGRLQGLSGGTLREAVERCIGVVGLADRRGSRVKGYSGGMKRRLNLAAAILHRPALVFLDEPTAGVDPQSRNALFEIVEGLRGEGCTVVYSTHYLEEAQRLCDRVAIVDHGRLLALDTVPALIKAHGGTSTLVVTRGGVERSIQTSEPVAALEKEFAAGGLQEARVQAPDLQAVFLSLTGRVLRD